MPKRTPRAESGKELHATAKPGHNGYNREQIEGYVNEFEEHDEAIAEIMRKAREACQPHVDDQKAIVKAAAENAHVPKKVFRAMLRERSLERKRDAVRGTLSEDQQETLDQVKHALGILADTPLGGAVLDQHPEANGQAAAH